MGRPSLKFYKYLTGIAIIGICVVPFSGYASNSESESTSRIKELLEKKSLIAHCVYSKKQNKWVGCDEEDQENHTHDPEPTETIAPIETVQPEPSPSESPMPSDQPTETEQPVVTETVAISPSNEKKWMDAIQTLKIPANGTFSFRSWAEEQQLPKIGLKPMEKFASKIYRAALEANLYIGERRIHTAKQEISIPGFDLSLAKPEYNFTFWNAYQAEVAFKVIMTGSEWGLTILPIKDERWSKLILEVVESPVQPSIQIFSDTSQTVNSQEGQAGALIKVYQIEKNKRTILSRDYYEPIPKKMRVEPSIN